MILSTSSHRQKRCRHRLRPIHPFIHPSSLTDTNFSLSLLLVWFSRPSPDDGQQPQLDISRSVVVVHARRQHNATHLTHTTHTITQTQTQTDEQRKRWSVCLPPSLSLPHVCHGFPLPLSRQLRHADLIPTVLPSVRAAQESMNECIHSPTTHRLTAPCSPHLSNASSHSIWSNLTVESRFGESPEPSVTMRYVTPEGSGAKGSLSPAEVDISDVRLLE